MLSLSFKYQMYTNIRYKLSKIIHTFTIVNILFLKIYKRISPASTSAEWRLVWKIMLMRLFFTQLFVSERKQIALMAEEKSPVRISLRLFAINRSEMRIRLKNILMMRKKGRTNTRHPTNWKKSNCYRCRFGGYYTFRNK